MITHNLGYPRIGNNRELKKAVEAYWTGSISYEQLGQVGSAVRKENWLLQKNQELTWFLPMISHSMIIYLI